MQVQGGGTATPGPGKLGTHGILPGGEQEWSCRMSVGGGRGVSRCSGVRLSGVVSECVGDRHSEVLLGQELVSQVEFRPLTRRFNVSIQRARALVCQTRRGLFGGLWGSVALVVVFVPRR